AVALEAVVMAADDPAALAARLARAAGSALVPDPLGGYALALDAGAVRILPQAALGVVFPGLPVPSLPFIAGLVLRTDDACAAVARLGAARPVPGGWLAEAAGAGLLFIA
ncbi:MAG: VOC family protein, partial [Rhodospirillales bacterium]|nr:VOC family protein [Rhodospirillales bacterium]